MSIKKPHLKSRPLIHNHCVLMVYFPLVLFSMHICFKSHAFKVINSLPCLSTHSQNVLQLNKVDLKEKEPMFVSCIV